MSGTEWSRRGVLRAAVRGVSLVGLGGWLLLTASRSEGASAALCRQCPVAGECYVSGGPWACDKRDARCADCSVGTRSSHRDSGGTVDSGDIREP